MSEIIFPQELITPYEINYENTLASELVGNGVGIFISDDNLATVTNVVDGSLGASTDITSDEQGFALDGYRVGVDTSSLTAQQQADIDANPYQLFKTEETKREEYALTFDGVDDAVTFTALASTNNGGSDIHWSLEVEAASVSNETLVLAGNNGDTASLYVLSNGNVTYRDDSANTIVWASAVTDYSEYNTYKIIATYDGTTKSFELYVNGISQGVQTSGVITISMVSFNCVGNHDTSYRKLKHKYLKFIDHNDSANSRYWIFDRKDNPATVADEYSGAIATLVGFPDYSGYLFSDGSITGYQTNDTTYLSLATDISIGSGDDFDITIDATPLVSGNYFRPLGGSSGTTKNRVLIFGSGTVRLSNEADADINWSTGLDLTTINTIRFERISGALNLYVNDLLQAGGVTGDTSSFNFGQINANAGAISTYTNNYREVIFSINGTATNRYDFTTGDSDSIPDTAGNNHATITDNPTSGFLPVIEKQVYTVGTGKDYSTPYSFLLNENSGNENRIPKGVIYGEVVIGGNLDSSSNFGLSKFPNGWEIIGATNHDGNFDTIGASKISGGLRARANYTIKDLIVNGVVAPQWEDKQGLIENVLIDCTSSYGISIGDNGKHIAKNVKVRGSTESGIHGGDNEALHAYNCMVYDCNTSNNGYRGGFMSTHAINCVAFNNGVSDFYSDTTDSYCVSSDATATGTGSQTNATITLDANGLLDQITQDTYLKGQGWNGSDIASAFYAVGGIPSTGVNLLQLGSTSILDIKYCQAGILVSVELKINDTLVWRE